MGTEQSNNAFRGINRIGQKFARLTVIKHAGRSRHGENLWECRCECGKVVSAILGSSLRKKKTKSCGCYNQQQAREKFTTHGFRDSSTYSSWAMLVQRCKNTSLPEWKDYGGRGIKVYEEWLKFENFLADMGEKPSPQHSIDRFPDNNGNYEPGNCRWATNAEQQRNKRTNRNLTYDGITLCVVDWAKRIEISSSTLTSRLNRGWTVERALITPLAQRKTC